MLRQVRDEMPMSLVSRAAKISARRVTSGFFSTSAKSSNRAAVRV
jgi:hypothetical protein